MFSHESESLKISCQTFCVLSFGLVVKEESGVFHILIDCTPILKTQLRDHFFTAHLLIKVRNYLQSLYQL